MYEHFTYNAPHHFVFAFVPKVACTNWKTILRRLNGAEDWLDPVKAHDRKTSGLTYLAPQPDLPDAGLPAGAPRYTMVRDPYARALSAYLNKVERRLGAPARGDYWDKVVGQINTFRTEVLGAGRFETIDFEVFLRWLRDSGAWSARDAHWAPQSVLLGQPYVQFDYVGRFERIEADSAEILEKIGVDIPFPTQKQVQFKPTNAEERLQHYLTPACQALVEDIYADDFANFGYPLRGRAAV